MTNKNKKTLFLTSGILTGIIFIGSILDKNPETLFGSVWIFRLGWLLMTITSFISYFKLKKESK